MLATRLRSLHQHDHPASASASASASVTRRSHDDAAAAAAAWPSERRDFTDILPSLSHGNPQGMVVLASGVEVDAEFLSSVNRENYRKMTRSLAAIMFANVELATRSVTGQRWSRASQIGGGRPIKPALDPLKIHTIISCVRNRFPSVSTSKIKQVLAYKCKEASNSHRAKLMKTFGDDAYE